MQLHASKHGSHNMKETKFYNRLWIKRWLDPHQNHKKCGIVEKDNIQTLEDERDKKMDHLCIKF
jgi:hypothetical protein